MAKWLNEEALEVLTEYYYPRAKYLQLECNWGNKPYDHPEVRSQVNDDLMQSIEIYDCYQRRAAGFSNVLEDLRFCSNTPKWHHQSDDRRQKVLMYDTAAWDLRTWFFVYLVHRITGSGASFTRDHGYRNNIVQHWGHLRDPQDMLEDLNYVKALGKPVFTSIGNQPPAPRKGVSNVDFINNELLPLVDNLIEWLNIGPKKTHKQVVDFLNEYNVREGHRRFNFVYSAFSYDLGDYHKDLVDDMSHGYFGNNAIRCMKMVSSGYTTDEFMDIFCAKAGGAPRDNEDVLCDGVRFMQNYVPRSDDTYAHIPPGSLKNNSGYTFEVEQRN